jgi:hypothetical protein
MKAIVGIGLHDVPQDGLAPNLNQRLRPVLGLFPEASPLASAQNYSFHISLMTSIR